MYNTDLSDTSIAYFKTFLVTGFPDDSYWSSLWFDYLETPNDLTLRNAVVTRLSSLFREIMSQAEYHLS